MEEGGEALDTVWSNPLVKGPGCTITAMANPGQGGTVTGGGYYANGMLCTLTATPHKHYEFVNWTRDGVEVSDQATYSFVVSEDAEYQAHFVLMTYTISISTDPEGAGVVTEGGFFVCGSMYTLNGIANDGCNFLYWTINDELISSKIFYYFMVTEDAVCVAHFDSYNVQMDYNIDPLASIYPNPVNDRLTVESKEPIRQYEVYNLAGVLVIQTKEVFCQQLHLDLKELPAGTYLIRLTTDSGVLARRFVKQ